MRLALLSPRPAPLRLRPTLLLLRGQRRLRLPKQQLLKPQAVAILKVLLRTATITLRPLAQWYLGSRRMLPNLMAPVQRSPLPKRRLPPTQPSAHLQAMEILLGAKKRMPLPKSRLVRAKQALSLPVEQRMPKGKRWLLKSRTALVPNPSTLPRAQGLRAVLR